VTQFVRLLRRGTDTALLLAARAEALQQAEDLLGEIGESTPGERER
jgi:hypothetical protein